jgi:L-malate glycosyltransferase
MKVIHLIGGGDVGGAKMHVLSLVKELSKYIDVKIISFRPGVFAEEAEHMGINIEVLHTGSIKNDIRKLIGILRKEQYQVIHSHGAKANMIAAVCKRRVSIPIVTTVHSDYRLDYLQSIPKMLTFGLINTMALRFIDYYIGVSNTFRAMLIDRKFDSRRIYTVYNGIDFEKKLITYDKKQFFEKHKIKHNEETVAVGILARLHPVKNVTTFLKAAREVLKTNSNVVFLVGGDGEELKSLMKKSIKYNISSNVYFLGFLDNPYEFMSCLDINILTSLSESFPYSILEGAVMEKTTISSDVGGIPDLIDNGENGYLFQVGDYMKLSDYIKNLVKKKSLRNEVGKELYKKAHSKFSLKNMSASQLEIYNKILSDYKTDSAQNITYDVVISGYYGCGNIGDDAILTAIINDLKMYKQDIKILVISKDPIQTMKDYNVDSAYWLSFFDIISRMRRSNLFISGGGSLIQDIKSTRSLMYYLLILTFAKMTGLKSMLYANGIGPIKSKFNRFITKFILNRVQVITLRENFSNSELLKLSITKPDVYITADPALTLEPASTHVIDNIFVAEGIPLNEKYIGFSIREWHCNNDYYTVLADFANIAYEKYGYIPIFIPMQIPKDLSIAKKIKSKVHVPSYIVSGKYSIPAVIGIIRKTDILIGMRLHALIFATNTGTPFIAIEYEQKVRCFVDSINQRNITYAGHINNIQLDDLEKALNRIISSQDTLKNDIINMHKTVRDKALQNAKIAVDLISKNTGNSRHTKKLRREK